MDSEKYLKKYDYKILDGLIAQKPATPRDSAKLLVYNKKTKKVDFDTFRNLDKYLPEGAVLVFNKTKVIPARLELKKEVFDRGHNGQAGGGKVKVLYIKTKENLIEVMADRNINIGSKLFLPSSRGSKKLYFTVKGQEGKYYYLKPSFSIKNLINIFQKYGEMPIPPYIKHSPLSQKELKDKYQTVFAKENGSVAAPTASLHFTKKLLDKLKKKGFKIVFITLHVNLGTFTPLTEENLRTKKLHKEYFGIDKGTAKILSKSKAEGLPIIAVGTTVTRALETAVRKDQKLMTYNLPQGGYSGITDLFIQEGYKFRFISGMITNFHVPKSSLLILVSAFISRNIIIGLYKQAIKKKFRFFSFGDGMLIK